MSWYGKVGLRKPELSNRPTKPLCHDGTCNIVVSNPEAVLTEAQWLAARGSL